MLPKSNPYLRDENPINNKGTIQFKVEVTSSITYNPRDMTIFRITSFNNYVIYKFFFDISRKRLRKFIWDNQYLT